MPVTLPGPEATHRWQGRTLVDHDGEPLGSIEAMYVDKATEQPEWALLEADPSGPNRTYVPLVSASEEGDRVRVPFAKTLVQEAPRMAADRELSEDQEQELYRHYGVPYSRADSPSGLPAGEPQPDAEPALAAGEPEPAGEPVAISTPEVAAATSEVTAEDPTTAAPEPPAAGPGAGDAARSAAAAGESTPSPAAAVTSAPGPVDERAVTGDGAAASRRGQLTAPRVAAGAAALALVVGMWRRRTIARQVGMAVGRLGAIPATVSRQRRRRRRAKARTQAVTTATQQTTALARRTARLVTGTALLPVTVAVAGGRRARAAAQATGKAISRGARRVRPGRRRRRRGGTLGLAVGGAAGYVLGAKAGPGAVRGARRVDQAVAAAVRGQAPHRTGPGQTDELSGQAADKFHAARRSTSTKAGGSGGPPITVVPETPTATPPASGVVPPVDPAPMPAEPTVLSGEDAPTGDAPRRPAPPTRSPSLTRRP